MEQVQQPLEVAEAMTTSGETPAQGLINSTSCMVAAPVEEPSGMHTTGNSHPMSPGCCSYPGCQYKGLHLDKCERCGAGAFHAVCIFKSGLLPDSSFLQPLCHHCLREVHHPEGPAVSDPLEEADSATLLPTLTSDAVAEKPSMEVDTQAGISAAAACGGDVSIDDGRATNGFAQSSDGISANGLPQINDSRATNGTVQIDCARAEDGAVRVGDASGGYANGTLGESQAPEHDDLPNGGQARKEVQAKLQQFRNRMAALQAEGQAKPDMVAFKQLRAVYPPPAIHGHIPGVQVGDIFKCKGELAILGVHRQIMRGIDFRGEEPAFAIVLSGGYVDDEDNGNTFIYSGEGGQSGGKQMRDQTWTHGNLALKRSCETCTPVRVVRQKLAKSTNTRTYVYEGLYKVKQALQAETGSGAAGQSGANGMLVCKFVMEGIPGEFQASALVKYQQWYSYRPEKRRLVALLTTRERAVHPKMASDQSVKPRWGFGASNEEVWKLDHERLINIRNNPAVLIEDYSGTNERVFIPVVNEYDKTMPPSPEDFQYEMNIVLSESVEPLLEESMSQWRVFGCQRPREPPYFYEDGLLLEMNLVAGVFECGSSCGKECASNRVVAKGICYPLEIFYTGKSKGWGVRCSADIPAGAFVCKYTGELRTDVEAEEMENDEYLFDLSNFIKMRKKYLKGTLDTGDEIVPLPFSDDELRKDDYHGRYLVIDGRCKGNVSRFINHACGEKINLVGQPVLTPPFSNGLFYDIAFFAIRHIPAYEELTYDYGYLKGDVNNRQLECHCGARDCKKWLL